ncbi:unnamed protein product, partial [Ectocarpus fasciculatus]
HETKCCLQESAHAQLYNSSYQHARGAAPLLVGGPPHHVRTAGSSITPFPESKASALLTSPPSPPSPTPTQVVVLSSFISFAGLSVWQTVFFFFVLFATHPGPRCQRDC